MTFPLGATPVSDDVSLQINTDVTSGSGTDADIHARITCNNGAYSEDTLLDKDNYNDFEAGDRDTYLVAVDAKCDRLKTVTLSMRGGNPRYSDWKIQALSGALRGVKQPGLFRGDRWLTYGQSVDAQM
ncbi:PLAT/LH2 domain-containing protein [Streptomyces sp. NPDC005336]|uniref:PLAT/LH2 domain-containing protein n=1 Tax=Streptomyces sp. NPDC005336 TaxID=3157035 RepID=UPI0033B0BB1B